MYLSAQSGIDKVAKSFAFEPSNAPVLANAVVVVNSQGRQESFSLEADGLVWSFEISDGQQKAGKSICTGLQATSFTVGAAGDGRLVLVAMYGLTMHTCVENGASALFGKRWSKPKLAAIPVGKDTICLDKVFSKTEDGNLFVGVSAYCSGAAGRTLRQFWSGVWAGEELVCGHQPMHSHHVHIFWLDTFYADGHWRDLIA